MVILGGATLVCLLWAIATLLRGSYLTTFVALASALFWFAPLAVWIIMPGVVARGTADAAGTTIRPDGRVDALMLVCVVAGIVGLGSFGVLGSMNKLDIPLPPDIGPMYAFAFVGPAGMFLVALWLTVKRRGIGYVRLTLDGFEFVLAFSRKTGEWSQVTAVTGEAPDRPQAKSPLVMIMADGEKKMLDESALFTPGGRALLELMRFYWQHPECRTELTDGRALQRLHDTQLELGPGVS